MRVAPNQQVIFLLNPRNVDADQPTCLILWLL